MRPPLALSFAPQTDKREIIVKIGTGSRLLREARFYCRTGQSLRPSPDALFCLGLYPAAELAADLHVAGNVDIELLARAPQITNLFRSWWPSSANVSVKTGRADIPQSPTTGRTALFFSGGVDSGFSLLDARPRLSALITLLKTGSSPSEEAENSKLDQMCRTVAQASELEPIVVETNVADIFHPFAGWIEYHGSVLAAIGHLLSDHVDRVLIASSGDETSWQAPWGSHPALDSLFSSRGLAVEHHGLVSRFDKISRIVDCDVLMEHLRVCNRANHNCGVCDKCTFAMRSLEILGAEGRAVTFPAFSPRRGSLRIVDDAFLSEIVRLRDAAAVANRHDLVPEIDLIVGKYRHRAHWQRMIVRRWRVWWRITRHRLRWKKAAI